MGGIRRRALAKQKNARAGFIRRYNGSGDEELFSVSIENQHLHARTAGESAYLFRHSESSTVSFT